MPASPWKRLAEVEPEREYLAIVTFLPLGRYRQLPAFLRTAQAVAKQLEASEGALGYSLLAKLRSKRFWTLSVWKDEAALASFARAQPHRDVMGHYRELMSGFEIVLWPVHGSEVPLRWQDARARTQAGGGDSGRSAG
jgi:heme-degrading monooxygenase HmoA